MAPPKPQDFVIWGLLAGGAFAVYATLAAVQFVVGTDPNLRHWIVNLFVNILGERSGCYNDLAMLQDTRKFLFFFGTSIHNH